MADANIRAVITAKDEASHVVSGFTNSLHQATVGSFALVGALAVVGIGAYECVKAFNEAERSQAMLVHAVVDVTHATQAQLKATEDLSTALEKKGVLDGDNIKQGLAQLSTFGLSNQAVRDLGGSLADLAVNQFGVKASGDQLADSANMIAKALHGQFGILEKSGIRFTEAQKSIIQYGTETEKVTALNQGFQQNLKYTNEVARQTTEGAMAHLSVSLQNVQESIGGVISKGIVPIINGFSDWIDKMGGADGIMKVLTEKMGQLQPFFPVIAGAIVGGLIPAFVALGTAIWSAMAPLIPFLAAGAAIGLVVKAIVDHFGGWHNVLKILQPVLNEMKIAWEEIVKVWRDILLPQLKKVWEVFANQLIPAIVEFWQQNKDWLAPALKDTAILLGGTLVVALLIVIGIIYAIVEALKVLVQAVTWVTGSFRNGINQFIGFWMNFGAVVWGVANGFVSAWAWSINTVASFFKGLADLAMGTIKGISNAMRSISGGVVHVPGFAGGVENFSGGLAMVGEQGPELVHLPAGSSVTPNHKLGGAVGGTININANIGMYAGSQMEKRAMAQEIFNALQDVASSQGMTLGGMVGK